MQCELVAQADVTEKLTPLMWKAVPRQAATVLHIVRGTRVGPIFRTPRARRISAASTTLAGDPPPLPAIRPVRGLLTSLGVRPASAIAAFKEIAAKAAASPMKRRSRRSRC